MSWVWPSIELWERVMKSEPYWICDACAKAKGWVAWKTGNTKIMGQCGYCKTSKAELLTPTVDFKKPKETP